MSEMDIADMNLLLSKERSTLETAAEAMIPVSPAIFHILLAMCRGAKHGYGIMQMLSLIHI